MTNTLDDIIKSCKERRGLRITNSNKNKYVAFLRRQLSAHPGYDLNFRSPKAKRNSYPYLNSMVDKLLLFSYLIGETPIIAGYKGREETKKIKSIKDLYLLRRLEIGCGSGNYLTKSIPRQTDKRLYNLVARFGIHKFRFGFQSWGEAIDELGQDEEVIRYFGQPINYEITKKSPSPNTHSHGGYRWGKRRS